MSDTPVLPEIDEPQSRGRLTRESLTKLQKENEENEGKHGNQERGRSPTRRSRSRQCEPDRHRFPTPDRRKHKNKRMRKGDYQGRNYRSASPFGGRGRRRRRSVEDVRQPESKQEKLEHFPPKQKPRENSYRGLITSPTPSPRPKAKRNDYRERSPIRDIANAPRGPRGYRGQGKQGEGVGNKK